MDHLHTSWMTPMFREISTLQCKIGQPFGEFTTYPLRHADAKMSFVFPQ